VRTCHVRQDYLSCHRPDPARPAGRGAYHTGDFLTRHPTAAYARQAACSDCHNAQQFCVSCHAERDCTTCHAAQGGRRVSPHGPGFDPERPRRRNPEMCIACHGRAIPTRGAP
jgi:hypothetical protein